jgi:triosephosphate isomerase
MKEVWIGTSWKMNHLRQEALDYADKLKVFYQQKDPGVNIFICVPFTVLYAVADRLKGTSVLVASQNAHWLDRGAATGEISPLMVKDAGASMVELGHSERRATFAETDAMVNAKVKAALRNNLRPLVCIGETANDKNKGLTDEKLAAQLTITFQDLSPEQAGKVLVAYEPVWAIGESGSPASPQYANRVQANIKGMLVEKFGQKIAERIPVLYGGSVNQQNALTLISQEHIEGLFIGRAAWQPEGFIKIISLVADR